MFDSSHFTQKRPQAPEASGSGGEEEWEGFEFVAVEEKSSNAAGKIAGPSSTKAARKAKQKARKNQKQTNQKEPLDNQSRISQTKNAFEALNDVNSVEVDGKAELSHVLLKFVSLKDIVSAWQPLGLSSYTLSALARLKFTSPTPIQESAIPAILDGHDVIGKAVTGSGKTLAFGIPILEHYLKTRIDEQPKLKPSSSSKEHRYPPVALILSPTRELAHQLSSHLADLCSNTFPTNPSIATVTGGLSLHKQQRLLANADIVVGTPGRLWEVISGGHGLTNWLKKIKYLIVDEADRLLSEGHFKEMEEILDTLDRLNEDDDDDEHRGSCREVEIERQTLIFSATFQRDLQQKLAGKGKPSSSGPMGNQESMEYLLKRLKFREDMPQFIDANPISQMASNLKEGIVECAGLEKVCKVLPHFRSTSFTQKNRIFTFMLFCFTILILEL